MQTLFELGSAVAERRRLLELKQGVVAKQAEFGARKLLAVLAVLGMEINFSESGVSGTLDELRRERSGL